MKYWFENLTARDEIIFGTVIMITACGLSYFGGGMVGEGLVKKIFK